MIEQIGSFTAGMDATSSQEQVVVRLAVERLSIGLGEALSGLKRADPQAASQIIDLGRATSLGNILPHNYEGIVVDRLRDAVIALPTPRAVLQTLLPEPMSTCA